MAGESESVGGLLAKGAIRRMASQGVGGLLNDPNALRVDVKNIWYANKEVTLDGYRFIECRFDRCNLVVASAHFELDRCLLDDATLITFKGQTHRIVQLFTSRLKNFPPTGGMVPKQHPDGTISIGM